MIRPRVIPHLLFNKRGLHKGVKFNRHRYIGDPLNTIKLFNELGVDELMITDIAASPHNTSPDIEYLTEIASEAFMPLSYGGGICSLTEMESIFAAGYEKILLNTSAIQNPDLITQAAALFGSQSVVVSIDYRSSWLGRKPFVYTAGGKVRSMLSPAEAITRAINLGAGEIVLCSINHEGGQLGYDLNLLKQIAPTCSVPLVASGGAGSLNHLKEAYLAGASAMAAGSMFIFQGPHKAVLINYPETATLDKLFA